MPQPPPPGLQPSHTPHKADRAGIPKGSTAAGALKPCNFFHMVRLGQPPTDRDRAAPGAVQKAASGHLSARFAPTHPTRTQALPTPAPWRLKPQGAGGGGEAVLRRRAAPARRALRAGLGTHRARGARGLGPLSAPLTLETRSRGLQKPLGTREVRTRLSGILTPLHTPHPAGLDLRACVFAFGGQSPEGGRLEVRAFSVSQPEAVGDVLHAAIYCP